MFVCYSVMWLIESCVKGGTKKLSISIITGCQVYILRIILTVFVLLNITFQKVLDEFGS